MTGFGLAGTVCAVTGGGGGIGRAIVLALAAEGAAVAVLDRNGDGASETCGLVAAVGGRAVAVPCDVADEASVQAAFETVRERLGEAGVLVNNAALVRPGPLDSLSLADWNALLAVNLTGYFLCSQVFGRAMRARGGGALVHVGSITASFARPSGGAYSVAKAGISMLSRQLAVEWGPQGIRSNTVHPGMVQTALSNAIYAQPGVTERRVATIPSRRIGLPDDIAGAVVFLASPLSGYVNGTEVTVDGGFTANLMGLVPRVG